MNENYECFFNVIFQYQIFYEKCEINHKMKIKTASSDERALTVRAHRVAALSDCVLTCYKHVMMGRKQAVNVMSIRWCLSDFLCPVGGAMDMTQYWCTDLFMATPSRFLRDLAKIGNSMKKLLGLDASWWRILMAGPTPARKYGVDKDFPSMSLAWSEEYTDWLWSLWCPIWRRKT